MQNKLIDAILGSCLHVIATMRSKTEYVVENVNGKSTPRKVGMAPIQRADVEYEFDVYADMDIENRMIIQKSRCGVLSGQVIEKPDASLADVIQTWLEGEPLPEPTQQQVAMKALLQDFYNLSPLTYARIHNWELMALRAGLGIKAGPIPTDYTDEHVELMRSYVATKKQEKESKAS